MPLLPRFTDAGKALQLRALDGEQICFTKIQMGSGKLGETSYKTLNSLLEPKVTIPINDITVSDGYAAIRGYFNNKNISEGFYYREIGLFAKDPDDDKREILYCYGNSGEYASYIAEPNSMLIERSIKIIAVVDDAENVSAVINGSVVYVDFTDLRKEIEKHNSDPTAHSDMRSQTLTWYLDCNSTEDDELCDGSYSHPFKNFEGLDEKVPDYVCTLIVILKTVGRYTTSENYFGYSNALKNIIISYNGSSANRPTIVGTLNFGNVESVAITRINFAFDEDIYSTNYSILTFDSCDNVRITSSLAQCNTTDSCYFLDSFGSNVVLYNCEVLNMANAINAYDVSNISISKCNFNTLDTTIICDNSTVYVRGNCDNYSYRVSGDGLIFTPAIIEKITDGSIVNHLSSAANPHRVSLDQAMQEGGTIDVPHGGTGQKNMAVGSLLTGNGENPVSMLTGTGAVYSTESGKPTFGTLPVQMGGTGKTTFNSGSILKAGASSMTGMTGTGALYSPSTGNPTFGTLPVTMGGTGLTSVAKNNLIIGGGTNLPMAVLAMKAGALYSNGSENIYGVLPINFGGTGQSSISSFISTESTDGVYCGHIIIPGTNILVCWGRASVSASSTFDHYFASKNGNVKFANSGYSLIMSNDDFETNTITRYADHFHAASAVAARQADWIAIGEAASS